MHSFSFLLLTAFHLLFNRLCVLSIQLLVRSYLRHPVSTFSIRPVPKLDVVGIDLEKDDLLINPVTKDTQLMQGAIP
jgi:hypothetical protein